MIILFLALAAIPMLWLLSDVYAEYRFRRLQTAQGCAAPPYEASVPFGIPALVKFYAYFHQNLFNEYNQSLYFKHNTLTFREQTLGRTLVNTVDPENIKAVLATQFKEFDLAARHDQFQPLMGDGIFTVSGHLWQQSRAMLRPQFSKQQVSRLNLLHDHCETLLGYTGGGPVDIQQLFFKFTLDTATEFLFGESTQSLQNGKGLSHERARAAEEFVQNFQIGQRYLLYRTVAENMYWLVDSAEYRRATRMVHAFVDYYVQRAIDQPQFDPDTYRYVFLEQLSRETHDPVMMRDQALSALLAGRDTTASLLSFAMALLLRHKEYWYELRDAVLQTFGTGTDTITFHSLKRFNAVQDLISEVLRLYPVVPINSRQAAQNTTIPRGGGVDGSSPIYIPKGTIVQYHSYTLHRHPNFFRNGNEFDPHRWRHMSGAQIAWKYIPFNGGPRMCIGQEFALTEAAYVITRLAQTYRDIQPTGKLTDIRQSTALTSSVAGGVPILFIT